MKKNNVYKFLYVVSALLFLAFAISFGVDAYKYLNKIYVGSAPLELYLLLRAIEFALPSVILFIVGLIVKKKFSKKEKNQKETKNIPEESE